MFISAKNSCEDATSINPMLLLTASRIRVSDLATDDEVEGMEMNGTTGDAGSAGASSKVARSGVLETNGVLLVDMIDQRFSALS